MNKTKEYNELSKFVKKSDFWIGLIILLLAVGAVATLALSQIKKRQVAVRNNKIISPIPMTVTPKITMTISISPTPKVEIVAKQIKKLADTGTNITVVVQPGDTFWSLSEYVCGDGKYFETTQAFNGYKYRQLYAGDVITVYCE